LLDNPVSPAESYGEFASQLIERLTAQQLAREILQQGAVQAKRYNDLRTKPFEYYVGNSVWFIIHVEDSANMQNGYVFFY
jgi:hypothetical protein